MNSIGTTGHPKSSTNFRRDTLQTAADAVGSAFNALADAAELAAAIAFMRESGAVACEALRLADAAALVHEAGEIVADALAVAS